METLGPLPELLGGGSRRGVQPAVEDKPLGVGGCCRLLKGTVLPPTFLGMGGMAGAGQGRIPRHWSLMQGEPLPSSAELRLSLLVSPANPQNTCDYNSILRATQGQSRDIGVEDRGS